MTNGKNLREVAGEPVVKALRFISLNLGLTALVYSILYLGPAELVRTERTPEQAALQISIVQNLDAVGPVWPFVFMLAGIGIFASVWLGRGLIVAHGIAAGVWIIYGLSIIFSALLSEPPSPVLTGSAAILGAVTHIGMARAWAGEGVK